PIPAPDWQIAGKVARGHRRYREGQAGRFVRVARVVEPRLDDQRRRGDVAVHRRPDGGLKWAWVIALASDGSCSLSWSELLPAAMSVSLSLHSAVSGRPILIEHQWGTDMGLFDWIEDAAALVALGLFGATIFVWAAIIVGA